MAVVRYLNFSKIAKNGFNMQFKLILNVFCPKIDKLLHISVQFYTELMTSDYIPIKLLKMANLLLKFHGKIKVNCSRKQTVRSRPL